MKSFQFIRRNKYYKNYVKVPNKTKSFHIIRRHKYYKNYVKVPDWTEIFNKKSLERSSTNRSMQLKRVKENKSAHATMTCCDDDFRRPVPQKKFDINRLRWRLQICGCLKSTRRPISSFFYFFWRGISTPTHFNLKKG